MGFMFLNCNKRVPFSGWITLTFLLNHTKTNMATNSPKWDQEMATLTTVGAIQGNTQTSASQGQGLHVEKHKPKAGFRAKYKIVHM